MGELFLLEGNFDNLSAKAISLPGIFGGAACMGFLWIISRGLWLFWTVICWPCMYEIFQGQNRQRHSLYVGISGLNISKCFTGEAYWFVVLEESSTEAIFTGISLQDKGLCAVIICKSVPKKHVANTGLQVVKCLICGGVPVSICYLLPEEVVLDARPGERAASS